MNSDFDENERRFLVGDPTIVRGAVPEVIAQGYLLNSDGWVVRIRRRVIRDQSAELPYEIATLAVKGPRSGVRRFESEYDVPIDVAVELFKRAEYKIFKSRFALVYDGIGWDIDQFHLDNEGLIIAECEMEDPVALAAVVPPPWCTLEVTGDPRYNNEELSRVPYPLWQYRTLIERLDRR